MSCSKHKDMDGQIFLDPDMQFEVDNCIMELDEVWINVTVEILKCPICGKISVGWYKQPNTIRQYPQKL